jgi:two-component system response regulator
MKGCRILLIEDNPDDVELTKIAFDDNQMCNEVTVAEDGQKALDYLFRTGEYAGTELEEMPALILLDLNLPVMSGLEVLQRIRGDARTDCLPVIILTSSKQDEDIMSSYRLGANAFVRKPVEYDKFVEAANTLGMFWLMLNEMPSTRKNCL